MSLSTMNGRERVLAAMRRQPVDYVPCSPLVNPLTDTQRRGRPWNFPWPEPGDGVEYLAAKLGLDPVVALWWMGGICPDPDVKSRVWREGELLHKEFETPSGKLHASILHNDEWPFGEDIPFFHDFNHTGFYSRLQPGNNPVRKTCIRQFLPQFHSHIKKMGYLLIIGHIKIFKSTNW